MNSVFFVLLSRFETSLDMAVAVISKGIANRNNAAAKKLLANSDAV